MGLIDYRKVADFIKAFSHPVRLMIVAELLKEEKCVSDIKELVNARQSNISQHLAVLRSRGIVDWHQKGNMKCYFLKNPTLVKSIIGKFINGK